jgi:phage-related protein
VELKPVIWIGSSLDDLRTFPEDIQDDLGYSLYRAQTGEFSEKAKRMQGNLRDVVELVATDSAGTFRLIYTVKLGDVVYVLHAFKKKAKHGIATPQNEIELIARRLRLARMLHENQDD